MERSNKVNIILHLYSELPDETHPGWVCSMPFSYSESMVNDFVLDVDRRVRWLHGSDYKVSQLTRFDAKFIFTGGTIDVVTDETPWPFVEEDINRMKFLSGLSPWYYHHITVGEYSFISSRDAIEYVEYLLNHDLKPADEDYVNQYFRVDEMYLKQDLEDEIASRRKLIDEGKLDVADLYYRLEDVVVDGEERFVRKQSKAQSSQLEMKEYMKVMPMDKMAARDYIISFRIPTMNRLIECIVYKDTLSQYDQWVKELADMFIKVNNIELKRKRKPPKFREWKYEDLVFGMFGTTTIDVRGSLVSYQANNKDNPNFEITQSLILRLSGAVMDLRDHFCRLFAESRGNEYTKHEIEKQIHKILDPFLEDE